MELDAGNVADGRVSGCRQAIQSVASSGLAAPHSSQKNSSDDCCMTSLFSSMKIALFIIDEEELKKQRIGWEEFR
jgi:hypothetical protein